MRSFRRLTIVVLAVAFVLTSMTAAFAADAATLANADKAATLKDLGLYSGQDANDPKVGLENALTTQDSLIFLAKLFGYFESSSALADDEVADALAKFDDAASISEYAKNVVAYSAANGILSGASQGDKLFVGAKDTVTAARFATFMLRQMGYTVADYKVSVAKLAETKGSKIDAMISGDLTRDAAVGIMYGALTAEKASGKTVIVDIVSDNADLKKKMEEAGLLDKSSSGSGSKALRVVSMKALNGKQIEITFNIEMDKDSAQDKANYTIKDKGNIEKTLTNNSCKLGNDMKTVTITLDSTVQDCLTNASKATVIVDKEIMAIDAKKLGADEEVAVEVQDGLLPTVKEVKATGERNIKITFSEPVYETNNTTTILDPLLFKVVSGTYQYYVQSAELNLDVINLNVGTKLIEGPISVTVNEPGLQGDAIQDYAGYKVFKSTFNFNYVRDTSVSVVTVASAKDNQVVLNFSKPVKASNIKLYHSEKNNASYMAEETTTGYVDKISFTFDTLLPVGTLKLFLVNSDEDSKQLVDGYGVKVPDQTLTVTVTNDTTAPRVIACKPDKGESIIIDFNERLDEDVASNSANYVVKKVSDNTEVPLSVILDDSMKSVELEFFTKLEDNTAYQLLIKKYQDVRGNKNTSVYEHHFTTGDNYYPQVIDDPEMDPHCFTIPEEGKIFIIYSEPMNEAQMLDKINYQVSLTQGGTYMDLGDDDTITKVNNRTVQIYFKAFEGSNINPYVRIAPIMDLAGKRLYGLVDPYIVQNIDAENVCIETAQLIAKNKIKLLFNRKMANVSASDIELTNLTTEDSIHVVACESTTMNSDGKTEAVLILNEELATDVTDVDGARIGITTIDNPASESEWGSKLRSQFSMTLDDKTAPEIITWNHDNDVSTDAIAKVIAGGDFASPEVYDNDYTVPQDTTGTITIFFSEDIQESTLTVNTFNVTGFTITNITAAAETKTVMLTVKANADNAPVKTTVTQASEIYDTADNAFAAGSTWAVTLEDKQST